MIVCGWCEAPTLPDVCSHCGRDPAIPWLQRDSIPPVANEAGAGRPTLDAGQVRQRVRMALNELGPGATNAELAEHLGVSDRTINRWLKVSG